MGTTFELEESDFAGYIEDDEIYAATVAKVKVVEKPYDDDDGNKVKKVEFKVVLRDDSGVQDGTNLWGETSTKFNTHPDCRLRNWACAVMGTDLPVGYRLDTDVLEGQDVRVVVGLKEYTKDGQTKQRNFVKDIMPSPEAMDRMAAGQDQEPF